MNLFDKYGGVEFWSDFLNIFYDRVVNSPVLKRFFIGKNIERIKGMLVGLLDATLLSEEEYPESLLVVSHSGLNIKDSEMDEWVSIYSFTLDEMRVESQDKEKIIAMIEKYRSSIVKKNR